MARRMTKEYREGWKACEAGKNLCNNPYHQIAHLPGVPLLEQRVKWQSWNDGFAARGEKGFDITLPRKVCSWAFQ